MDLRMLRADKAGGLVKAAPSAASWTLVIRLAPTARLMAPNAPLKSKGLRCNLLIVFDGACQERGVTKM